MFNKCSNILLEEQSPIHFKLYLKSGTTCIPAVNKSLMGLITGSHFSFILVYSTKSDECPDGQENCLLATPLIYAWVRNYSWPHFTLRSIINLIENILTSFSTDLITFTVRKFFSKWHHKTGENSSHNKKKYHKSFRGWGLFAKESMSHGLWRFSKES